MQQLNAGDEVFIEIPSAPAAFVPGAVLRVEGDHLVASDARTYPLAGGEDVGNRHPRHILHLADPITSGKALRSALRQRVLGLVAEATLTSSYIPSWEIVDRIGKIAGAVTDESHLIEDVLRQLVGEKLLEEVPDLGHRYRLPSPPIEKRLRRLRPKIAALLGGASNTIDMVLEEIEEELRRRML
jgi:hypothetical protein